DKPILNINAKRLKRSGLNPAYDWHCRLGHINKKHVEKLHRDGRLDSFDYESFETCESCFLGKMTKTPFTSQGERAFEYGYIYLMIHKSESFERFKQYQIEVQKHSSKMIKFL
ncbi:hypothetical protein U9M48_036596, partial [Paspalum notatum var. saurae]